MISEEARSGCTGGCGMAGLATRKSALIASRCDASFFRGNEVGWVPIAPSRKLWTALQALDGYLTGQSDWMVHYAERHRAGLRVGIAITEGTANFLGRTADAVTLHKGATNLLLDLQTQPARSSRKWMRAKARVDAQRGEVHFQGGPAAPRCRYAPFGQLSPRSR